MALLPSLCTVVALLVPQDPARLARDYAEAVEQVNRAHADRPKAVDERELAARMPAKTAQHVAALVACADSPALREALVTAGEAALDLDRVDDFDALRTRLLAIDPERAAGLGIVLSRPRFVAIGRGGVQPAGLVAVADAFDLVLDGYAEVFGLTAFSKVPGKKLRLRVRLVERIEAPPHFAPQFPWHSEIDFPVVDADSFSSPTKQGQFLFYGLCHELGHVVAMWGDRQNEEDRHAWAHYTGVVLVSHLLAKKPRPPALERVRDERWRSLDLEQKRVEAAAIAPGGDTRDAVLARLFALHEAVGPLTLGEALNALDRAAKHLLVNRVRYYAMADFEQALLATKRGKAQKKKVTAAFAGK